MKLSTKLKTIYIKIDDFREEKIAKYIVQENSKKNKALQKQLQKKSKMYRKRHQND